MLTVLFTDNCCHSYAFVSARRIITEMERTPPTGLGRPITTVQEQMHDLNQTIAILNMFMKPHSATCTRKHGFARLAGVKLFLVK